MQVQNLGLQKNFGVRINIYETNFKQILIIYQIFPIILKNTKKCSISETN